MMMMMSSLLTAAAESRQCRRDGRAAHHLRRGGGVLPGPGHRGYHLLPVPAATFQGHERAGLPLQVGDPGKYKHIT